MSSQGLSASFRFVFVMLGLVLLHGASSGEGDVQQSLSATLAREIRIDAGGLRVPRVPVLQFPRECAGSDDDAAVDRGAKHCPPEYVPPRVVRIHVLTANALALVLVQGGSETFRGTEFSYATWEGGGGRTVRVPLPLVRIRARTLEFVPFNVAWVAMNLAGGRMPGDRDRMLRAHFNDRPRTIQTIRFRFTELQRREFGATRMTDRQNLQSFPGMDPRIRRDLEASDTVWWEIVARVIEVQADHGEPVTWSGRHRFFGRRGDHHTTFPVVASTEYVGNVARYNPLDRASILYRPPEVPVSLRSIPHVLMGPVVPSDLNRSEFITHYRVDEGSLPPVWVSRITVNLTHACGPGEQALARVVRQNGPWTVQSYVPVPDNVFRLSVSVP